MVNFTRVSSTQCVPCEHAGVRKSITVFARICVQSLACFASVENSNKRRALVYPMRPPGLSFEITTPNRTLMPALKPCTRPKTYTPPPPTHARSRTTSISMMRGSRNKIPTSVSTPLSSLKTASSSSSKSCPSRTTTRLPRAESTFRLTTLASKTSWSSRFDSSLTTQRTSKRFSFRYQPSFRYPVRRNRPMSLRYCLP